MTSYLWIVGIILWAAFTNVGTRGDSNKDQSSKRPQVSETDDIYHFLQKNPNLFVTRALDSTSTIKNESPDLLYRLAITEMIELFESQIAQTNYTIVHLNNVWGAEDKGVQAITEKLNRMKVYIEEKQNALKVIMDRDITSQERSNQPVTWPEIEEIYDYWKEVKKFIDSKIEQKALTKTEEDELYEFREWLRFSDQELALPYDAMKRNMKRAQAAEPSKKPPTPTVIRPFSPRYG